MPTKTSSNVILPDQVASADAIPQRVQDFEYVLPAIRGVQAGREYYVTMCPLRLVARLLMFDDDELKPELRAQRNLNRARIPEIARYITDNPASYVFSALTASVDADTRFEPHGPAGTDSRVGRLTIPMSARFVVNDGQHRRAAIQRALAESPEFGDETIAIVLFPDLGLDRCQQMFADLNRYAIRPARSISVLYDHRDEMSTITRLATFRVPLFKDLTETEGTNLSVRSRKLFTLSGFHTANRALLDGTDELPMERRVDVAAAYWETIALQFPEWGQVYDGVLTAGEVRKDFIHSHGIVLHALGRVGNTLIGPDPEPARRAWKPALRGLSRVDWRRGNAGMWEGRAVVGGQVCKSGVNVLLTTAAIRRVLRLPLPDAEQRAEDALQGADK
jgi:DNA sulfur modification protein DndB